VKLNDKVAIVIDSTTSPHRYRKHRYSGTDGPWKSLPDSNVTFLSVTASTIGFNSRGIALETGSIVIKSNGCTNSDNTRPSPFPWEGARKITP
jgi:hypothetical protein